MHHDEKYCKNCGQHLLLDQKFCHSCGQKADTHRINYHFLAHEIQHGIFHIDGGIFFTIKELFTRPGHSIREYLDGRRQQHFKPVLLIMILGTISILLNKWINKSENLLINTDEINSKDFSVKSKITKNHEEEKELLIAIYEFIKSSLEWINHHYAIVMLCLIPLAALSMYLSFFRKKRYNYAEWLVISTFLTAQMMVIFIIFIPLNTIDDFTGFYLLAIFSIGLWTIFQLFHNNRKLTIALRYTFSLFLYMFFVVLLIVIIFLIKISLLVN